MRNRERILTALMKNPRMSDRKIAQKIGLSQPTVTRTRNKLERLKIINYATIPDLAKLGYEMVALSELPLNSDNESRLNRDKRVIFSMRGMGCIVTLSTHKNYADFSDFYHSYMVRKSYPTTTADILKNMTFREVQPLRDVNRNVTS